MATSKPRKVRRKPAPAPMIRTSERTQFNRCAWAWDRSYNDRLTPIVDSPPLRFGSLVHAALEQRYPPGIKRGPKPAPIFEQLFDQDMKDAYDNWGFRDTDGEWADAKQLGVSMLEHYVETYGRDEEWKVLASEMTFKVPVLTPPHPEGGYVALDGSRIPKERVLFYYVGTMDGVWQNRMDGGVRINDYKTCKGDPVKEAQGKAVLDEQATAYWTWGVDWLETSGILKPREFQALDGMLYTFLRKGVRDERPTNADGHYLNQDGTVSKKQPLPFFHRDLVYRDHDQQDRARERAIHQAMEMHARRTGRLPIYKAPGLGYPDQQCKACPFFDVCELHEMGQDYADLAASTLKAWDPYDAHEIQEEGKYA